MHILLVDDDIQARRMLARLLQSHGFSILGQADNGAAALRLLTVLSPDLILTDCQMPILDGIRFVRALRQRGAAMPVIMLSGQPDPSVIRLARQAGVDEYLHKPLNPQALIDCLHRIAIPAA